MDNLMFWLWVVALTPITLDLAWRLVSGIPHWIIVGLSRVGVDADPSAPRRPLEFDPTCGCIAMTSGTSSTRTRT